MIATCSLSQGRFWVFNSNTITNLPYRGKEPVATRRDPSSASCKPSCTIAENVGVKEIDTNGILCQTP